MTTEFSLQTLEQVEAEMRDGAFSNFLVDGLIHSTATTILGDPYVGKTFLAVDLAAALANGESFLGREVTGGRRQVAILSTDPGGRYQITTRARVRGVKMSDVFAVSFYTPEDETAWKYIRNELQVRGVRAVIIDNTTDLAEDANSPKHVKAVTDGMRMWMDSGLSIINIHHLNKGNFAGQKSGMGSMLWQKWTRMELTLSGKPSTNERKLRAVGNDGAATQWHLSFRHDGAPFFTVDAMESVSSKERQRSKATLDRNESMAGFILASCQGMTKTETAEKVAGEYGLAASTVKSNLSAGRQYGALLVYDNTRRSWTHA